ncbi:MAG: flagellar filament capping protein FliD [Sulfurimonas sp.]|uniref:flagellar filament capping protein FliD n=1 Tax=Sulfurimonas sp. TaxID=2022749 RepID=UPI0028CBE4E9|nr:flagellar filament capping protein FliD [Sulfurimonas sp.]MDT8338160.1 flagellar filament capping protein FliD [Sulfurimonas sp.]
MAISSLGVGSSILTQDVLDQLREADEAQFIRPVDLSITNENDKKKALELVDANMTNLIDSIDALKTPLLYDERTTSVAGTSVEVTAAANTDIQDFTLDVVNLATKQIEQSGTFTSSTELIAAGMTVGNVGSMNLNIDGVDFAISYDSTTTLDDLKNSINSIAGDKVDATIVQISSGQFSLFISSADTGTTQDITLSDTTGDLLLADGLTADTRLTSGLTAVQTGVDANFTFNGQAITRTSNNITDLIVGLDITLKEVGSSAVSVAQDREGIMTKIDSFVAKYNAAITELSKVTKSSTESEERGIFSSESTIKSMKRALENMFSSVGGGVGTMSDFGFDIDKDGKMSVDKGILNTKMDEDPTNVEAFFSGGMFTNADGTQTAVSGVFNEMSVTVGQYTTYNATLDQFKDSINDRISALEERKTSATERLDAKYEILAKQYAAYDAMIAKLNNASSMFTEMANTSNDYNS